MGSRLKTCVCVRGLGLIEWVLFEALLYNRSKRSGIHRVVIEGSYLRTIYFILHKIDAVTNRE